VRIVALAHEPISHAECQRNCRQSQQVSGGRFTYLKNDELARHGQQRNQEHDLRLDDALVPRYNIPERMVEFECDQQRHDLAED